MLDQTNSISGIRCSYCYSYMSISQNNSDKSKLILYCENCGKKDISLENFYSLIQKNNTKVCNLCYKNFQTKELLYSSKKKHFLCKKCYFTLLNQQLLTDDNYIYFKDIGKYCKEHKNNLNLYFCKSCEIHVCSECLMKHQHHCVKNISEESKKKFDIESLILMIKQEEKEIESLENFGQILLNSLNKIFNNEIKNREELLCFKKLIYLNFVSNSNNYEIYKKMESLFDKRNNPDFFINDTELNDLVKILNDIDINPNLINNNQKKENNSQNNKKDKNYNMNNESNNENNLSDEEIAKRRSLSTIKQNKRFSQNSPNITNETKSKISNKRKNNRTKSNLKPRIDDNKRKNLYALVTPIKSQRSKNKKYIEKSNNMINNAIRNNTYKFFYSSMNIKIPQENEKNESLSIIQTLKHSIICMLFLESNKILISVFSPDINLILTNLEKNKETGKNTIIMNILNIIQLYDKPIIHMEKFESDNILSCTVEKIIVFKILDKKIHINNIIANNNIISCTSLEKNNFLVLQANIEKNLNEIYYYSYGNNNISLGYKKNIVEMQKDFKVISMEKISNITCVLVVQKINYINNNKNESYIKFMNIIDNKFSFSNVKELICIEKEKMNKIFIKKLFDNYLIILESINCFAIYDYLNDIITCKIQCENVISAYIKSIDNEQINLYTIVKNKDIDEKIIEDIKIKKYLIKKADKGQIKRNNLKKDIEINALNSSNLSGYNKNNSINNMLVISDDDKDEKDKNGSDNNLVLLADNAGNIFYKYY